MLSQVSRHLCERWNISQLLTPTDPTDPPSPGDHSAEVLRASICSVVNEKPSEWDAHLDPVLFEFRTSVNSATKYSPFFLMFNRYVCLSSEVTAWPRGALQELCHCRSCRVTLKSVPCRWILSRTLKSRGLAPVRQTASRRSQPRCRSSRTW